MTLDITQEVYAAQWYLFTLTFVDVGLTHAHDKMWDSFLCQLTCPSADINGITLQCLHTRPHEHLLQKYKAQRHAVTFKRYLIY